MACSLSSTTTSAVLRDTQKIGSTVCGFEIRGVGKASWSKASSRDRGTCLRHKQELPYLLPSKSIRGRRRLWSEVRMAVTGPPAAEHTESSSFFERLAKAWAILFPSKPQTMTVRQIAKQRLQVILASDRCAVSVETQKKIVNNIVEVLSDFVEIEAEEKVQLDVTADEELGTVYSVIVPVRRVRLDKSDMFWYEGIEEATFNHTEDESGRLVKAELKVDPKKLFEEGSGVAAQGSSSS